MKESLHGAEWTRENFIKKWDLKNRENLGRISGRSALIQKRKAYKEVEIIFKIYLFKLRNQKTINTTAEEISSYTQTHTYANYTHTKKSVSEKCETSEEVNGSRFREILTLIKKHQSVHIPSKAQILQNESSSKQC